LERFQKSNAGPSWIGLFQNNWTKHTRKQSLFASCLFPYPQFVSPVHHQDQTYLLRSTMISRTNQHKGQPSSSIQSPSNSTSSASPYMFSLGRPGGVKPLTSPSQNRSRLVTPTTQSQNRQQLFSRPQSFPKNNAVVDNRPNFSNNAPPRTKGADAISGSGHAKMTQPLPSVRVLAGSTHGTALPTFQRPSAATLRGPGLVARPNRPGPYTLTITPPVVSKSNAHFKTEEERWERIRYLREKAGQIRLELLALEQEEQDLISPLMSTSHKGRRFSTDTSAISPESPISSPSPPVSPLSPALMNNEGQSLDQGSDHLTYTKVTTAKRVWIKQPEGRPTVMAPSTENSSVLSPDDVEAILNGYLNDFHEGELFSTHLFSLTFPSSRY
jgi:hypothetical protein